MPITLRDTDRVILQRLQRDACLSTAEIAEQVGMFQSRCWWRMRRQEEAGVGM